MSHNKVLALSLTFIVVVLGTVFTVGVSHIEKLANGNTSPSATETYVDETEANAGKIGLYLISKGFSRIAMPQNCMHYLSCQIYTEDEIGIVVITESNGEMGMAAWLSADIDSTKQGDMITDILNRFFSDTVVEFIQTATPDIKANYTGGPDLAVTTTVEAYEITIGYGYGDSQTTSVWFRFVPIAQ